MKCKDIPTLPILCFLAQHQLDFCTWVGPDRNVRAAMPPDVPPKLSLAKMGQLIRQGLVDGCACGCRGDFEITPKGLATLCS